MRISEVFESIQGEGTFAGTPSLFIRTTGCNLRCWFCDTPYTSWEPSGDLVPWQELAERASRSTSMHVVLTGGEPLLQPAVVPLCTALRAAGKIVTIETAGTVFRPAPADLLSISPKLANSTPHSHARWSARHDRLRHSPGAMRQLLSGTYQLKFVIDVPDDLTSVLSYLRDFPEVSPDRVWLMPQGVSTAELHSRSEWLEPLALAQGFHFCPRRHIEWFGHTRGT